MLSVPTTSIISTAAWFDFMGYNEDLPVVVESSGLWHLEISKCFEVLAV